MPVAVSPISLVSSLLALGAVGVLFALHHLRARPARRAVATLLFWQQGAREQRSRTLWSRRFTHRRTFLLLSLLALLLALSLSADRWGRRGQTDCVIVIDTGASMATRGGDGRTALDAAIDAVRRDVRGLSSSPIVIAAGPGPRVVSRSGVAPRVLSDRLGRVACGDEASDAASSLELAGSLLGSPNGTIEWYTDRPALPDGLPPSLARRTRLRRLPAPAASLAIAGIGFTPGSEPGAKGTLRVRLAGRSVAPAAVNLTLGDDHRSEPVASIAGQGDVAFDGVAADGRTAVVELADAPGPPATHVARFALPNRPILRYCVLGDIPQPLRAALAALGSETTSPAGAIVVAAQDRVPRGAGTRAIVVVDAGGPDTAARPIEVAADAPRAIRAIDFAGASAGPGPAVPDSARAILSAGPAAVAGIDTGPDGARLYVSTALVGDTADLPRSAAFPELIARLADELEGANAGAAVVSSERLAEDPLWPSTPGPASSAAVVFDAPLTVAADAAPPAPLPLPHDASGPTRWPWETLSLVAGLTLLIVEGFFLAARKII